MKTAVLLGFLVCLNGIITSPGHGQEIPKKPKSSVPGLVSQLADTDYNTRFEAGLALARLGTNAAPALPAIGRLIETEPDKFHDVC